MEKIRGFIRNHKAFVMYGLISVFVTVIDVIVCRVLERYIPPVAANTIGVITGFIIQYFLTARHVYKTMSRKSFIIFLLTFFLNLLMADGIVYVFRTFVFGGSDAGMPFLISKGASIVLPFFITYFIRSKVMPKGKD
ncbi:MAG: GtrA family protein [Clostridiales bacterium]|nr:GtrA family protein [Clostridiales bacterium]